MSNLNFDEKLKEIIMSLDLGYEYRMSDYAISDEQEKEYEEEGLKEVNEAIDQIKQLISETIGEGKDQYLTIDNLKYQYGWCDGRQQLRNQLRHAFNLMGE